LVTKSRSPPVKLGNMEIPLTVTTRNRNVKTSTTMVTATAISSTQSKQEQTRLPAFRLCIRFTSFIYLSSAPEFSFTYEKQVHSHVPFSTRLSNLFFNFGGLTDSVAQVVELRSANFTATNHFHFFDIGGMNREDSFNAYAVRYAAHRE